MGGTSCGHAELFKLLDFSVANSWKSVNFEKLTSSIIRVEHFRVQLHVSFKTLAHNTKTPWAATTFPAAEHHVLTAQDDFEWLNSSLPTFWEWFAAFPEATWLARKEGLQDYWWGGTLRFPTGTCPFTFDSAYFSFSFVFRLILLHLSHFPLSMFLLPQLLHTAILMWFTFFCFKQTGRDADPSFLSCSLKYFWA